LKLHDYECPTCGWSGERYVDAAQRDEQFCVRLVVTLPDDYQPSEIMGRGQPIAEAKLLPCGAKLERVEISAQSSVRLDTVGSYQMQAVLGTGEHVAGQFGRASTTKRKKRTKL
jgi:hypothetical protein